MGILGKIYEALSGDIGRREDRAQTKWIESVLRRIPQGCRLLDAGCGEQPFRKLCPHVSYVGQDLGTYDGRGDSSALQMGTWDETKLDIKSDITSIPEPDGSFDAILCTNVLELVADPIAALHELARLLGKGGLLILTAPFCGVAITQYHFSTGFSRHWYEWHLREIGFEVIEITPNGNFFESVAFQVRQLPWVVFQYCPRPGSRVSKMFALVSFPLLLWLGFASKHDSGSAELLCTGYHVLAKRI